MVEKNQFLFFINVFIGLSMGFCSFYGVLIWLNRVISVEFHSKHMTCLIILKHSNIGLYYVRALKMLMYLAHDPV